MIEKVVGNLRISPPSMSSCRPVPEMLFINPNPQCGSLPLTNLVMVYKPGEPYAAFRGDISPDFIKRMILPRGRPHFSLLHVALVDDNIGSVNFTAVTGEEYGRMYRVLESGTMVCFHREAFYRGSLKDLPRGAIFVDGYVVYWQCLPYRNSILQRGTFQVAVMGLVSGEEVPIVSIEGGYFKRKGVLNISKI